VKSIRIFLTLALLAVVTLLNFAAALRGYKSSMAEAESLFNERMQQQIDLLNYTLPDLLARGDIENGLLRARGADLLAESLLEFQWLRDDGSLLARSPLMPETPVADLRVGARFANFSGYRWHLLLSRGSDDASWIVLAERDDQRFRMAESIILPAVYPMLLAIPVLGILIWSLLGLGLRPVSRLAAEFERREATDLHPIEGERMPGELRQLAQSANRLLARLEASFNREKRFSADAAHELKTPIAALSIQCDNLAFAAPEREAEISKLRAGIERMNHLVGQILMLNRIAPDHYLGRFEPVNLTRKVQEAIERQIDSIESKAQDIECLGEDAWINGDAYALESLLGNLLGNAIKYSPPGGRICIELKTWGDRVLLQVSDDGIGIAPEQRDRVFDRFYRAGGDRHDSKEAGCGLGLSIVRQVADLHDARIGFADSPFGKGTCVVVDFKRGSEPSSAADQGEPT
jgi:two-component system sensor histidine kinase QseC